MPRREIALKNNRIVCSWSGGKDSCLALYRAVKANYTPVALLSMLREDGLKSRSHGLPLSVLKAQSTSLDIPLITRAATWDRYEALFIDALKQAAASNVETGVFGDLDIEEHRLWEEKVCATANIRSWLPLWKNDRKGLLHEFLSVGFKAVIVATNEEKMGQSYLGEVLDTALIKEFDRQGIDVCGEEGEYHTLVYDGPLFSHPLEFTSGNASKHSGYWFLEIHENPMRTVKISQ